MYGAEGSIPTNSLCTATQNPQVEQLICSGADTAPSACGISTAIADGKSPSAGDLLDQIRPYTWEEVSFASTIPDQLTLVWKAQVDVCNQVKLRRGLLSRVYGMFHTTKDR